MKRIEYHLKTIVASILPQICGDFSICYAIKLKHSKQHYKISACYINSLSHEGVKLNVNQI